MVGLLIVAATNAMPMFEGVRGGKSEFAGHFLPSSLLDAAANRMMKNLTDRNQLNQQTADHTLRDLMVQESVGSFSRRPDGVLGLVPNWPRMKQKFP